METVAERLERARNVWLCVSRPQGPPHVTPVWFLFRPEREEGPSGPEGVWWIGTGAHSLKARLAERFPMVSLALEDGDHPLVAEGEARVHPTRFPALVREGFLAKYGWDPAIPERPGEPRALLEVRVRRWLLRGQPA
ncbi:pyridoxamine 5'-phosphate oxidase family protein [Streptomyces sp. NPDC007088]|uniref:pyridoxamine 5'-phosphate oxidase family protein n=1 Tax=Streptomyces sp. NPDC007088 TaxID=3364773 RepID=UPI0036B4A700